MGDVAKYFNKSELACPCCGLYNTKPALLRLLDLMREGLPGDTKLYISSGCRCKKHNAEVGGEDDSTHLDGEGADIYALGRTNMFMLLKLAMVLFKKVGIISSTCIHVDIGESLPSPRYWTY